MHGKGVLAPSSTIHADRNRYHLYHRPTGYRRQNTSTSSTWPMLVPYRLFRLGKTEFRLCKARDRRCVARDNHEIPASNHRPSGSVNSRHTRASEREATIECSRLDPTSQRRHQTAAVPFQRDWTPYPFISCPCDFKHFLHHAKTHHRDLLSSRVLVTPPQWVWQYRNRYHWLFFRLSSIHLS